MLPLMKVYVIPGNAFVSFLSQKKKFDILEDYSHEMLNSISWEK